MPVLALLVCPGTPVSQQPKEKLVEQVHFMKGDRDAKTKKLPSAVVVNVSLPLYHF